MAIPPKPHTFDYAILGNPDRRYNSVRQYYLGILRGPNEENSLKSATTGYTMMPFLAGDDAFGGQDTYKFLKLTDTQYFFLEQWAQGKFHNHGPSRKESSGEALTRAGLENCVGGAFSPGIEMTWISRNPEIYSEPFRIKLKETIPVPLAWGWT